MDSFDFDRLEPIALDQTLEYLRALPEPGMEDYAVGDYRSMVEDAIGENDWLEKAVKAEGRLREDWMQETVRPDEMSGLDEEADESSQSQMRGPERTENPTYRAVTRELLRQCTWNKCEWSSTSSIIFGQHMNEHYEAAAKLWFKGSRCLWQGCKSKASFGTERLYRSHLKNIHAKPLLCTETGCKYKKPFRDENDLTRHQFTKHSAVNKWECPYDFCEAQTKTFARKDKLMKHIRDTQHQDDARCPFSHCRARQLSIGAVFSTRKQIVEHFVSEHSPNNSSGLSCGLGSCASDIAEQNWSQDGLARHLYKDHFSSKYGYYFLYIVAQSVLPSNSILTVKTLDSIPSGLPHHIREDWNKKYHDCKVCA